MSANKIAIKYKKERVILSDVLPFEVPITFSNRHFYGFLIANRIELVKNKICWNGTDPLIGDIIKLLFGCKKFPVVNNEISINNKAELKTIPFAYKVCHKENDFRELTLIHPKNQLAVVDFYENNKELLLYYCGISPFSIRRANRIARFIFHKDTTHRKKLSQDSEGIEMEDKEYESLKTYFVYKEYSNIHKFYESYKYHYCEKKYNNLFKFDISKCFDSIYTHSMCWALLNKDVVKDYIVQSNDSFGGRLDTLMQNMNYGETNGIIIGPEFSRIFAEILLQKVDKRTENALKTNEKLIHKVDYEVFRYVDDFFVFYNQESTKDKVLNEFRVQLKEFKLYLNDAKTITYGKPIITVQTIAKQRIAELFDNELSYKITESDESTDEDSLNEDIKLETKGYIYINSNKIITKFKSILKEIGVDYKDILNFSLALIEKRLVKMLKGFLILDSKKDSASNISKALLELIELTFFLYAVYPRVNTTIRLCRILRHIVVFSKGIDNLSNDLKHLIFKGIYDNICFILNKNKALKHTQVETLYLLIALGEIGKEYWLSSDTLRHYFSIGKDVNNVLFIDDKLNYFSITVLLFYMKDKKRYDSIREFIKSHIISKFKAVPAKLLDKNTELILLLFDCLSCPYLDLPFKRKLLSLHEVKDQTLQLKIINKRKYWFTKWTNFDFGRELDSKHSQEVY